MVILVSGFLSSIRKIRVRSSSLIFGLHETQENGLGAFFVETGLFVHICYMMRTWTSKSSVALLDQVVSCMLRIFIISHTLYYIKRQAIKNRLKSDLVSQPCDHLKRSYVCLQSLITGRVSLSCEQFKNQTVNMLSQTV